MKQFLNVTKVPLYFIIQTTPLVSLLVGTRKMRCLIWCLSKTWKPSRWRSCQSNLKRSRDRSRDKASRQGNSETSWIRTTETPCWRTTETSLDVSFDTLLRRCWDVLMERCYYISLRRRHNIPIRRCEDELLRRLGNVPLRRHWVIHLRRTCDVAGMYREMSLRRPHDVLLPGGLSFFRASIAKFLIVFEVFLIFAFSNLILSSWRESPSLRVSSRSTNFNLFFRMIKSE